MAIYSLPSIWYVHLLRPGILDLEKVLPSQHEPGPMVTMATGWVGLKMQEESFDGYHTLDIVESSQFADLALATTLKLATIFSFCNTPG